MLQIFQTGPAGFLERAFWRENSERKPFRKRFKELPKLKDFRLRYGRYRPHLPDEARAAFCSRSTFAGPSAGRSQECLLFGQIIANNPN